MALKNGCQTTEDSKDMKRSKAGIISEANCPTDVPGSGSGLLSHGMDTCFPVASIRMETTEWETSTIVLLVTSGMVQNINCSETISSPTGNR